MKWLKQYRLCCVQFNAGESKKVFDTVEGVKYTAHQADSGELRQIDVNGSLYPFVNVLDQPRFDTIPWSEACPGEGW